MSVKKELDFATISNDYYLCNLIKTDSAVIVKLGDIELFFEGCLILKCGYPNEEIYMHYDFYDSIDKYCLFEVIESSWLKEIIEMNKVHPRHNDESFKNYKHFMILFEDEIFECISVKYEVVYGNGGNGSKM